MAISLFFSGLKNLQEKKCWIILQVKHVDLQFVLVFSLEKKSQYQWSTTVIDEAEEQKGAVSVVNVIPAHKWSKLVVTPREKFKQLRSKLGLSAKNLWHNCI